MKKLTTQEFIEKARSVHGDKYDYSNVEYITSHKKIKIICSDHGTFEQRPNCHLNGRGCPICGEIIGVNKRKMSTSEFINKAQVVHNGKYDYSLVNYIDSKTKISIVCSVHGMFNQKPCHHLIGSGCSLCKSESISNSKKSNIKTFIEKAKIIHGDNYSYIKSEYVRNYIKLIINCPKHGDFYQTPNDHLSGAGCPGCALPGFDRTKNGYVYLLRSECGRYAKIGITHNPKSRHRQLKRDTPFSFHVIESMLGSGMLVSEAESMLLKSSEQIVFDTSFNGHTEWRLWSNSLRNTLISFMAGDQQHGPV